MRQVDEVIFSTTSQKLRPRAQTNKLTAPGPRGYRQVLSRYIRLNYYDLTLSRKSGPNRRGAAAPGGANGQRGGQKRGQRTRPNSAQRACGHVPKGGCGRVQVRCLCTAAPPPCSDVPFMAIEARRRAFRSSTNRAFVVRAVQPATAGTEKSPAARLCWRFSASPLARQLRVRRWVPGASR